MSNENNFETTLNSHTNHLCALILEDVKKSIEAPPPHLRFESTAVLEQKTLLQTKECTTTVFDLAKNGFKFIMAALEESEKFNESRELIDWFTQHMSQIEEILRNPEGIEKESLAQKLHFPKKLLHVMHQGTNFLLSQKRYDEAVAAINLCITMQPDYAPFWFTYGCILQLKEAQEEAIFTYNIALLFESNNPLTHVYIARSWTALGQWKNAQHSLEKALEHAKDETTHQALIEYCHRLQQWISNHS